MAVHSLNLNFDQLREIAHVSVRRAAVFMGIAENARKIEPPISHVLADRAQFFVVPPAVTPETSHQFLDEFVAWTIANGLREMIEAFSLYLTECYGIQQILAQGKLEAAEYEKVKRKFEFLGIEEQMQSMIELLALDPRFAGMFGSLNRARNCLAHRRGVVGLPDISAPDNTFTLVWRTRTVMTGDGQDLGRLLNAGDDGVVVGGGPIRLSEVERSKTFQFNEPLRISRHELSEICFGIFIATEQVCAKLIEFAKAHGMKFNGTSVPSPE